MWFARLELRSRFSPRPLGRCSLRYLSSTSFIVSTRDASSRGSSPPRRSGNRSCLCGGVRRTHTRQLQRLAVPNDSVHSCCEAWSGVSLPIVHLHDDLTVLSTVPAACSGAFFTRAVPRRARSLWPLGRSGVELRIRVGAAPAVTPVPIRPTSTTHDSIDKERELLLPWFTPFRFPRGREPSVSRRVAHRGDPDPVCAAFVPHVGCRAYLGRFVIEASRAPHGVRCSRDPGPAAELRPPTSARAARCDNVTRSDLGSRPVDRGSLLQTA